MRPFGEVYADPVRRTPLVDELTARTGWVDPSTLEGIQRA